MNHVENMTLISTSSLRKRQRSFIVSPLDLYHSMEIFGDKSVKIDQGTLRDLMG